MSQKLHCVSLEMGLMQTASFQMKSNGIPWTEIFDEEEYGHEANAKKR